MPTALEVNDWLEWAGGKLMALPMGPTGPRGFKVAWPDFPPDAILAYGYNGARLRAPTPAREEIPIMDEILLLPNVIKDAVTRRVVQSRTLVTPISGRHIYPWTQIARLLHRDPRTIMAMHRKGLDEIVTSAPEAKVCRISSFFADAGFLT